MFGAEIETFENGLPAGRVGATPDGSTGDISSWIAGSRQPARFPTLSDVQWITANFQSHTPVLAAFSHTSPVSLSRTASPPKAARTWNRGAPVICLSQVEVGRA